MGANPFASDWLKSSASDDSRRPRGGLSRVAGETGEPLKLMTVAALLDRAVARHGAGDAVIFAPTREHLSWHTLKRRSDDVAAGLLALGVGSSGLFLFGYFLFDRLRDSFAEEV